MKKISISGINICVVNRKEIIDELLGFAMGGRVKTAYYLNAHCFNLVCLDKEYADILNRSDLVYAGGAGIIWASRVLGTPLPERVNILDFFDELAAELIDKKITIYLLGEKIETIKKVEAELKRIGLNIVGSRDGFFIKDEEKGVINEINVLKPDILMVGMGVPKQEKWINCHSNELDVKLCWAVGGVFKIFSGELKHAPRWIIDCGLEWLYLGLQDPVRLWRRYFIGNVVFIYHIVRCKLNKLTK